MARSATTGRYIRPRRRIVGTGRAFRIVGPGDRSAAVGGVSTGEPFVLGAQPRTPEPKAAPKSKD